MLGFDLADEIEKRFLKIKKEFIKILME